MNTTTMIPCRPWFPAANHAKSPTHVASCDYPKKINYLPFRVKEHTEPTTMFKVENKQRNETEVPVNI